jgi:diaminobutyrate-2-oxoglutarate transaminase
MVTLSKSLSGLGLPFAITLIRRDLDVWQPGEHNGTFRGNNHAFVTATAALDHFWSDDSFAADVRRKSEYVTQRLAQIAASAPQDLTVKGRGMMQGLSFADPAEAGAVSREAWRRGMIIETSGPNDEVVKCLCPLTISNTDLERGLTLLAQSVEAALSNRQQRPRAAG